jgi:hypothetical protein
VKGTFFNCVIISLAVLAGVFGGVPSSSAAVTFAPYTTPDGYRYLVAAGEFEYADSLEEFNQLVATHHPAAVVFNSGGGNVFKAMEFGRLIRLHRLSTIQIRGAECSSACALAFLGGVSRFAEPGSIGVHKSSFADTFGMDVESAVSAIQQMTSEIIAYIVEMGADPGLLQLALQYDSNDIRYLSRSEMESYRVIPGDISGTGYQPAKVFRAPNQLASPSPVGEFSIPEARGGLVRHPKGVVRLKSEPLEGSSGLAALANGTRVRIIGNVKKWYEVNAEHQTGYLHHTWVKVDEYDSPGFNKKFIQIKSFADFDAAAAYARGSLTQLNVYLANNGWFAVTYQDAHDKEAAALLFKQLKSEGRIPSDSLLTYGNTYVRKVCCD